MTMDNLEKCFNTAKVLNQKYVGVEIEMQGLTKPEIIINESENFDSKLAYYKKAYNEDLTFKAFNGVKIAGFTFGDNFKEIEEDLIGL